MESLLVKDILFVGKVQWLKNLLNMKVNNFWVEKIEPVAA